MWMHRYRPISGQDKNDFGWFNRIAFAEFEFQSVCLVHIERVLIKDLNIHEPFFEAFSGNERYAWR